VLKKILVELQANPNTHAHYTLEHDKLHYKGRLVLSASSQWTPKLLHEYHTTPQGSHSGIFCTYKRIAQFVYSIGMKKRITKFVAAGLSTNKYQA